MHGQPAKILRPGEIRTVLGAAARRRSPERNRVMVLLSIKAGLRACEIAGLTWEMVIDARGRVGTIIELPASIAKNGSRRRIPLHPDLHKAMTRLKRHANGTITVICSERGGPMSAKSVVNWFTALYAGMGLEGCSSHSGRRTFVTRAARLVQRAGGSLRDVQELAGHRSIKTTQGYIDGDTDAQRRLIRLI